jgi:hypothetical protein
MCFSEYAIILNCRSTEVLLAAFSNHDNFRKITLQIKSSIKVFCFGFQMLSLSMYADEQSTKT